MSIIPPKTSPYDAGGWSSWDKTKEHMQRLEFEKLKALHEMKMQEQRLQMEAAIHADLEKKFPNSQELIHRIMEMQKKYIDRLEAENARLTKELEKHSG